MKTMDKDEIREMAEKISTLDAPSQVLIRNGITILADRQKMAQVESGKESK